MTVIYYGEGEHPAGFVGYRVARTIGVDTEYRQKYFSLNVYPAVVAFKKAHKLDSEWKKGSREHQKGRANDSKRKHCKLYRHWFSRLRSSREK